MATLSPIHLFARKTFLIFSLFYSTKETPTEKHIHFSEWESEWEIKKRARQRERKNDQPRVFCFILFFSFLFRSANESRKENSVIGSAGNENETQRKGASGRFTIIIPVDKNLESLPLRRFFMPPQRLFLSFFLSFDFIGVYLVPRLMATVVSSSIVPRHRRHICSDRSAFMARLPIIYHYYYYYSGVVICVQHHQRKSPNILLSFHSFRFVTLSSLRFHFIFQ